MLDVGAKDRVVEPRIDIRGVDGSSNVCYHIARRGEFDPRLAHERGGKRKPSRCHDLPDANTCGRSVDDVPRRTVKVELLPEDRQAHRVWPGTLDPSRNVARCLKRVAERTLARVTQLWNEKLLLMMEKSQASGAG